MANNTKRNTPATTPATTPAAVPAVPAMGTVAAPLPSPGMGFAGMVAAAQAGTLTPCAATKYTTPAALARIAPLPATAATCGTQAAAGMAGNVAILPHPGKVACGVAYSALHTQLALFLQQCGAAGTQPTWAAFSGHLAAHSAAWLTPKIVNSHYGPHYAAVAAGTAGTNSVTSVAGHLRGYLRGMVRRNVATTAKG